jgi:uncharacterized protein YhbP (UPF0306 family)
MQEGVEMPQLEAIARGIVDSNRYMTLGTADESGAPWVSPVWYAMAEYRDFFWVSSPESRHSRNIATRTQVSIVIFDSRAPINMGQGVYMSAVAEELTGIDVDRGIEIFSQWSAAQGAGVWTRDSVQPPAPYRLYRASVAEHFVLDSSSRRTPVSL